MADVKTKENSGSVESFLNGLEDETKRQDSIAIVALMKQVTGIEPVMWGDSIIGFGNYHYVYETGREGDWFLVGFSPRKQNLTVYLTYGFEQDEDLMKRLGKHKNGKACLYIQKLADVDTAVLSELIARAYKSRA